MLPRSMGMRPAGQFDLVDYAAPDPGVHAPQVPAIAAVLFMTVPTTSESLRSVPGSPG